MLPLSATRLLDCTLGCARPHEPGRFDVWFLSARIDAAQREFYDGVLTQAERERIVRYHFQADRDRAVVARGGIRRILSTYCGVPAEGLVFQNGEHGKPALHGGQSPIQFNISHAGDYVLIGVTAGVECGVDIEQPLARNSEEEIAESFFCSREVEWLRRTEFGFVRLWTMKEAIIKAVGRGLSIPLSDVDVTDIAEGRSSTITLNTPGIENQTVWLKELNLADGYAAAIATLGAEPSIHRMPED